MNYIAYYRVSTKQQGNSGLGLQAQKDAVRKFINGKPLLSEYTEIESGKKTNRIELMNAIYEAKSTGATLIIAKLDRLSRNASFTFSLMDSGVKFIAVDAPNVNELTIKILAVIAENEAKQISERTSAALDALKRNGVRLGNPENLTNKARERSLIVRSEIARSNVNNRLAYALIKELEHKNSLGQIAKKLNEGGFKTSTGKKFFPVQVQRLKKLYNE